MRGVAARNIFPRFDDNGRVLRKAYRTLADDVRRGEFVTSASEWLLDNFHLVTSEIRDIRQNLPRTYYRELPTLALRERAGHARIYAIAIELIRHSDSRLERHQLTQFLNSYQRVAPLTIGELWAWPSMLKLALVENLRRLADEMLEARAARRAADADVARIEARADHAAPALPPVLHPAYIVQLLHRVREYGLRLSPLHRAVEAHLASRQTTTEDAVREEHQREAAAQVSVANVVASLRLCSALDWGKYFEAVSLVEQVLQRDPAGVYGRMDFLSRDRQRQAVEEMAAPDGDAQIRVALKAVESAREVAAGGSTADRAAHVGYHLIDRGRRGLEADVAYRPPLLKRLRRLVFAHTTAVYLGSIGLVTALLVAAGAWYVRLEGGVLRAQVVAVLLLADARERSRESRSCSVWRRGWLPPRRLPRLEFADGIPETARTMVIVPTMLTSVPGVAALLEHLEVLALGNLDPRIHFAILSDFADAACARAARGCRTGLGRPRGRRGPQRAVRPRARRPVLSLPSRPAVERSRAGVDGLGAQARQDRGIQSSAARRDGHQLRRAGREARHPARRAVLHHARLRHPPAAGRGEEAHRHHRAPVEPSARRSAARPRDGGLRHPAAPRQRDDGERGGLALRPHLRRPYRRGSVHHRRVGCVPGSLQGGHFHRQGALRRGRVHGGPRGARPRERVVVTRPVRGCLRPHGARDGRRGGGRLSVERPRPRAAPAPLGPRRLADPVVAVTLRPDPRGRRAQPAAAHLALEDLRQPEAQPAGAGDRRPAPARVDRPPGDVPRSGRRLASPRSSFPRSRVWSRRSPVRSGDRRGPCSCGPPPRI